MTNPATMIIITSNQELIQQFSSREIKNTHIINVNSNNNNNDKCVTIIENNMTFLGELSGTSTRNDQIYKRAFDTGTDHGQTKAVKIQKTSSNLICAICGDKAIGFNYDVLSCAACKTFFRRNAHQNIEKLRCLSSQRQCSVEYTLRRKCPRCRLEKCFAVGMKKEFVLTVDELEQRKNRTDTSNKVEQIDIDLNSLFGTLAIEDWLTIENLRVTFNSHFVNDRTKCMFVDVADRASVLTAWSQFLQKILLQFIDFFREVNEFQDLDLDDRLQLIKCNIFHLMLLSKCAHYSSENDCCSNDNYETAENHRRFFSLCDAPSDYRDMFVNLILLLVNTTKQDPAILSLFSIILIVSPGLSLNENEALLKDPLAINRVQSRYTQLLWNYLVSKFDNDQEVSKYFVQLLNTISQMQAMMQIVKDFAHQQNMVSNTVDQMAPLMQTVLHIS